MISVKICGVTRIDHVQFCIDSKASYIGLVFYRQSRRNLTIDKAKSLADRAGKDICKVALVVNPEDSFLLSLLSEVSIDMLQLHGNESPERVSEIKKLTGIPVMKAIGISSKSDILIVEKYQNVVDQILIDAKPISSESNPGGNGFMFDWNLLKGVSFSVPWMLAGGLNPDNVAEAVRMTGTRQVDVSSGVEATPGQKDAALITAFVKGARI